MRPLFITLLISTIYSLCNAQSNYDIKVYYEALDQYKNGDYESACIKLDDIRIRLGKTNKRIQPIIIDCIDKLKWYEIMEQELEKLHELFPDLEKSEKHKNIKILSQTASQHAQDFFVSSKLLKKAESYIKTDFLDSALVYYEKAALLDNDTAKYELAIIHLKEANETNDKEQLNKGLSWMTNAAEDNDLLALIYLMKLYFHGASEEIDLDSRFSFDEKKGFKLAFEYATLLNKSYDDYDEPKYFLAELYYNGYYLKKDYKKSFEIHKELAESGYISSYSQLGFHYLNGQGTSQNNDKALYWLLMAFFNKNNLSERDNIYWENSGAYFNNKGKLISPEKFLNYAKEISIKKNSRQARRERLNQLVLFKKVYDEQMHGKTDQLILQYKGKWGVINHQLTQIVPFVHEEINEFHGNYKVKQKNKYGIYDTTGKHIAVNKYHKIDLIAENKYLLIRDSKVYKNDAYGFLFAYFNKDHKFIITNKNEEVKNKTYQIIQNKYVELTEVMEGYLGWTSFDGKQVVPFKYTNLYLRDDDSDLIDTKWYKKHGIFSLSLGKDIVPAEYESIEMKRDMVPYLIIAKNGSNHYLYPNTKDLFTIKGSLLIQYLESANFYKGEVYCTKRNKKIRYNKFGNCIKGCKWAF